MRPTFDPRPVNGPFDDPALYVGLMWEGRALLFDCGDIDALSARDIQKITDVFVTHAHIDHFIGFDSLLRSLLRRPGPLRLYGPENIVEQVEGKLNGYSWNLIRDYPFKLDVYAIGEQNIRHASFHARDSFVRAEGGSISFKGAAHEEAGFTVMAARLEHGICSMGYALVEHEHLNIDKSALGGLGLEVGPWLTELKRAIRSGHADDHPIGVQGASTRTLGELKRIVRKTRGQKITYVMDASPSEENIKRIIELAEGSDIFYCEAPFTDAEMDRARERSHLTAKLAGRIAREAKVRKLVPMHFSQKHRADPDSLLNEAMDEFQGR